MFEHVRETSISGGKILFVTTISKTIKAFLIPYAKEIEKKGGIIDAMCGGDIGEIRRYFRKIWKVNFTRKPLLAIALLPFTLYRVKKVVIAEKYDIVHVHTPIASFVTRMAISFIRKDKRPKVIYTAHGFHFHPLGSKIANLIYFYLEKFASRFTDYLITINEWDYKVSIEKKFLPREKIFYINGIGVDTNEFSRGRVSDNEIMDFRKEISCDENSKIFSVIGELNPGKRHIDVINAIKDLKDIKVVFAGEGKMENKILKKVKKMGINEKVYLLGHRNDVPCILRASEALIVPSIREGLPRVVMEAMAMETPVIASNIRGIRELLSEKCGLLIEPKNPKAIAESMLWIVENEGEVKRMVKRARKRVKEIYDIHIIMPKIMEIYNYAIRDCNNRNRRDDDVAC